MVLNKFVKHSEVPDISKSNSNNKLKPLTIMLKLANTIDINWNIINKEYLKPSRLFLFFENYHHYIVVSTFCFRPESWRTLDYSKKKKKEVEKDDLVNIYVFIHMPLQQVPYMWMISVSRVPL